MFTSRYNHLVTVQTGTGQTQHILCNLFTGSSDLINKDIYLAFQEGERTGVVDDKQLPMDAVEHFVKKGILWENEGNEEQIVQKISSTYGNRDQISAGLKGGYYGFITSLHCNLNCPYCFQKGKSDSCGYLTPRQVDLGLEAIKQCEARVQSLTPGEATLPKISITGGEPLLRSSANLEVLEHLMTELDKLNWPFSITSNGTELDAFVSDHDSLGNCRNIQVTLDGDQPTHDSRRGFRNGKGSFDSICNGIDSALAKGWKLTLRVNLDFANVSDLPNLSRFVQRQAWLEHENFSAYVSPVTDHGAIGGYETPKDEADLLEALLEVVTRFPEVRDVFDIKHFRGFNYVERILLQNNPRYPVVTRCEAVTGMYIFDPLGDIHVCLEAVGDKKFSIGSYDPVWAIDEQAASRWSQRTVLGLTDCDKCKIRFICSGGCSMESFNHNDACMPFLEEIDIAWRYYAQSRSELFA